MKPGKGRDASERNITKGRIQPDATRPAPPVYRPQPTPKVLQRKVVTMTPVRPPIAQSKVRPAPPRVLPATTIQRAADNRWATTARATLERPNKKDATAIGRSGSGKQTGQVLRQTGTPVALKFLAILQKAGSLEHKNRSGFTCAEPNAVANLIAQRDGPTTVSELLNVKVRAIDSAGQRKAECPVCQSWIHLDLSIIDLTQPAGVPVDDEGQQPADLKMGDFYQAPPAPPGPAAPPPNAWLGGRPRLGQPPAPHQGQAAPRGPAPAAAVPKAPAGAWAKRLGEPRQ